MDFIDWSQVVWVEVITYAVLVLIAAFIGNFINIIFNGNPITGAIIAALLFSALFIGWKYYPHGIDIGQMYSTNIETVAKV
tara:strand:+ start:290 stop:532 length:243 start_codon:yes stop_codon:yes gene_type:complete